MAKSYRGSTNYASQCSVSMQEMLLKFIHVLINTFFYVCKSCHGEVINHVL